MKKRRLFLVVICLFSALLVTQSALAAVQMSASYSAGSVYRSFTTSDSIKKNSGQTWSKISENSTNTTYDYDPHAYDDIHRSRPVTSGGALLGEQRMIYSYSTDQEFVLNASGRSAAEVHLKIHNEYYATDDDGGHKMSTVGTFKGTF